MFERPENAKVFDYVEQSQMYYRDLVSLAALATECAQAIQERAVKAERENPGISLERLEFEIGKDLAGQMSMAVLGLGVRTNRNESVHLKAFNVLRAALNVELNTSLTKKFRNLWSGNGEATLLNLNEAEPKFRLEALPPLPKALAEAVAKMNKVH